MKRIFSTFLMASVLWISNPSAARAEQTVAERCCALWSQITSLLNQLQNLENQEQQQKNVLADFAANQMEGQAGCLAYMDSFEHDCIHGLPPEHGGDPQCASRLGRYNECYQLNSQYIQMQQDLATTQAQIQTAMNQLTALWAQFSQLGCDITQVSPNCGGGHN